jgi:pimeloyl-[acyl-carrier protein] methyl ester esterase
VKLVLLPGLDGTGDMFAPLIAALGATQAQIVSYPPDREMSYAEHTSHARALMPHEPFVLLGESFSGPVAIDIAASAPDQLRGLILCCSFARNPLPFLSPLRGLLPWLPGIRLPPRVLRPLLFGRHGSADLRALHARIMRRVSARTLKARVTAVLSVDHTAALARIRAPILYLRGSEDRLIPASSMSAICSLRPDVQVQTLEAPHFLLQTKATEAARIVQRFMDDVGQDG